MRVRTIRHPMIASMQKQHFLLLDVGVFIAALLAGAVLSQRHLSALDWATFALMWLLGVIGIELGYHRYFSHGAFKTGKVFRGVLIVLGAMGGQGPVVTWASTHRHHHNFSDTAEDSHSPHWFAGKKGPNLRSIVHSQVGWKWNYAYPNPSLYTPHLLQDPVVTTMSRYYYVWVVLGLLFPAALEAVITQSWQGALHGFLLGGVIRLFLGQQATFLINSLCHLAGSRPFASKDQSRNIGWLALPTLGGSLHNSHHAFPSTANNGLLWWQLDPGYWLLRSLRAFGVVTDLRVIGREQIKKLRSGGARPRSGEASEPVELEGARPDTLTAEQT